MSWLNWKKVSDPMSWLKEEKRCINEEYLAVLSNVDVAKIQQFYPSLLEEMHIETLVQGNLYEEDALKLAGLTESIFKPRVLPQTQLPIDKSILFPPDANLIYYRKLEDPANINHRIEYILYFGTDNVRLDRVKIFLLVYMTHNKVFDQLKTKERLEHVALSGISDRIGFAYVFNIQSQKIPVHLEERIDSFLFEYSEILKNMSDSEFEVYKKSIIRRQLEKMKTGESARSWSQTAHEYFDKELCELCMFSILPDYVLTFWKSVVNLVV